MRGREGRRRENRFNDALKYNYSLEDNRRGLEWLSEGLEETKQEVSRTRHNFGRTSWLGSNSWSDFVRYETRSRAGADASRPLALELRW